MRTLSPIEAKNNHMGVLNKIVSGEVVIYPTDTIYGIGCNALDPGSVDKVRAIKEREDMPLSIIVPSKEWIIQNCELDERATEWLDKLPGPYTLILKLKNKDAVAENVNPKDSTIGIRMPNHWILDLVKQLEIPLITTSANPAGKSFMTSVDDLNPSVKSKVRYAILEGEIKGRPSTIVNLTTPDVDIKERD